MALPEQSDSPHLPDVVEELVALMGRFDRGDVDIAGAIEVLDDAADAIELPETKRWWQR